ncbi:hypothetical protein ASF92_14195 [Pedobacter sp. Leaf176]|nr:hypothetical protein ASF92_14195 [Pedobacter sp. Leaf176]
MYLKIELALHLTIAQNRLHTNPFCYLKCTISFARINTIKQVNGRIETGHKMQFLTKEITIDN